MLWLNVSLENLGVRAAVAWGLVVSLDSGCTAEGASDADGLGDGTGATASLESDGLGDDDGMPPGTGSPDPDAGTTASGADSGASDGSGSGASAGSDSDSASGTTSASDSDSASASDSGGGSSSGDTGTTGGAPLSDDPFDPAACNGVPWSAADAMDALGGLPREILANATIQVRTRECPGGVCGPWSDNADWSIHYLTWSGGVVTAYKDFLAEMNLVLYDADGTARLSMQHVTFAAGGYPDQDGVLYDFPPSVVAYPHLRAYDVAPDSPYYYVDLDFQVRDGTLVLGDGCAVWTAAPYGQGMPDTAQYGAVFHW